MTGPERIGSDRESPAVSAERRAAGRGRDRPGALAVLFAILVGVLFLAVFFVRFPPAVAALARVVRPSAAAVVVLAAGFASGELALTLARSLLTRLGGLEHRPSAVVPVGTSLLVGLPLLGTMVALVAWTRTATQLLVSLLALALGAAGALLLLRRKPRPGAVGAWDVALLGPPVALALWSALSPVTSPDELVYKLAIPKAYLLFGGMVDLPLNSYSYASTALSHVSLAALALEGGVAAKLVHAVLFVAVLAAVRRLGEQLVAGAGLWTATVLAWTPALMVIAGWAWTEWALLGLLLVSYSAWLDFERTSTAASAAVTVCALAGAAAVKYTALPWIAVFAVAATLRLRRRALVGIRVSRVIGASALVLAALGGFFYLRNWVWSGSPLAPFLLPGAPSIARYRSGGALSGWQELLLGFDIVHSGIVDDALGILLPLCALVSPLAALRLTTTRTLFWTGLIPLPFLVAAAPTSRLMLGSLAPLGVVGAVYLARSWRDLTEPATRVAVGALAGVALTAQLLLVLYVQITAHDVPAVLVGAESDAVHQTRTRNYSGAYRWLEANTPPQSRVLLLGENRSFALDRPAFSAGNFDGERMAAFLGRFPDAESMVAGLRRLGVGYVLVHWPWLRVQGRDSEPPSMLEREFLLPLPRRTALVLQDLVDRVATRRYQDDHYSVYELPAAAVGAPQAPR